jgi:dihydroorotate dehydrogenase electron transfer subunit
MMRVQTAAVVDRAEIARDIVRLNLRPERWDAVTPGQFVHAAVEGAFLRRPVSIAGADEKNGILSLIVQRVGAGTARLSEYAKGDTLKLLSPLGRGFDAKRLNSAGRGVWIAGGGVGVAPLLLLARRLHEVGSALESFAGFRSPEYVYGVEELERYGPLFTAVGGIVTDTLRERLKQRHPAAIAACGPVPMLKAVQALCFEYGIEGRLSLEAHMGCGLGACLVCGCKIRTGEAGCADSWTWKRVCADGPVFDAREVIFDD